MGNMIAEVKRVEQTLRYLAVIAEQAGEGIVVVDVTCIIRFVNTACARMHGYNIRNELVGKPISVFHTKEQTKTDVIPFIKETKHRGQLEGPVEHMRKDGTVFPTYTKMTMLKDKGGKAIGLIVFVADVSGRRQAEELLKQQTAQLTEANEQLQSQVAERKRMENELQEYRNQFEQQTAELAEAYEHLQSQVAERKRMENELQEYHNQFEQQTAELATAINRVIQFAESGARSLCHKT